MRSIIFALVAACMLTSAGETCAQRIATRERTPKIKTRHWLDDIVPQQAEYTYIEFIRSTSLPCIESCRKIKHYTDTADNPFRVVLITHEAPDLIDRRIRECLGGYVGLLIDDSGRLFDDFGVRYVPFGIILDKKRRAVWFGNPLTTDNGLFRRITAEE